LLFVNLTDITEAIELTGFRLTWHVIYTGERRGSCKFLVRKPDGKEHLDDLNVDRSTISKGI
jgi:hypothetical protein